MGMKVQDVMTRNVATARPDTTLEEIATMMRAEDVGAVPIVEAGELVGIVTDRDIVVRCIADGRDTAETVAEDVMSADVETIETAADISEASRLMSAKQIRRLPVVDQGKFIGMVSLGDIAVKQQDRPLDQAGSALQQISIGVREEKPSKRTAGPGRRPKAQGIGNRDLEEEEQRQSRVLPFREQGQKTPRRKTG
jgi:CBS domain-containing protein